MRRWTVQCSYPFPGCPDSQTHLALGTPSSASLCHCCSPKNPSPENRPQGVHPQALLGLPRSPAGQETRPGAGTGPETSPVCPGGPRPWTCLTPESHLACYCAGLRRGTAKRCPHWWSRCCLRRKGDWGGWRGGVGAGVGGEEGSARGRQICYHCCSSPELQTRSPPFRTPSDLQLTFGFHRLFFILKCRWREDKKGMVGGGGGQKSMRQLIIKLICSL